MSTTRYQDFQEMLTSVHQHVAAHGPVELADDPQKLLLGYRCIACGATSQIKLTDVKRTGLERYRNQIATAAGRLLLGNTAG